MTERYRRGPLSLAIPYKRVAEFFRAWDTDPDIDELAETIAKSLERFCKNDAIGTATTALHDFLNHLKIELEPMQAEKTGDFDGFKIVASPGGGTNAEWYELVEPAEAPLKKLVENFFRSDIYEFYRNEERGDFHAANRRRIVAAWLRAWADELDAAK